MKSALGLLEIHFFPIVPKGPTHLGSRCFASKVKNMNPNQLETAERHANAGKETTKQGELKQPADDYTDSVEQSILSDAQRKMSNAVEHARESFRTRHQHFETKEDAVSETTTLKQEAERGRTNVRQVRQKLMQEIGRLERDSQLSSDEQHRIANSVQQQTDKFCAEIDGVLSTNIDELSEA